MSCNLLTIDDILNSQEGTAEIINMAKKVEALKKLSNVHLERIKEKGDGRYYIYIDRKQIIAPSKSKLIDKLYTNYFEQHTLDTLFPEYIRYFSKYSNRAENTVREYTGIFENHISTRPISTKPITELSKKDFREFFCDYNNEVKPTRKNFTTLKGFFNGYINWCVEKDLMKINPIKLLDFKSYVFKPPTKVKKAYTINERNQILNYLKYHTKDSVDCLIALGFCTGARVGELRALRYCDITNNRVHICGQVLEKRALDNENLSFENISLERVDYVKGKKDDGIREIPLTSTAQEIIQRASLYSTSSDYLFYDGNFLTTVRINRRLKSICQKLNMIYRSSHGMRFFFASYLYESGFTAVDIQRLLGHANLEMTLHYLQDQKTMEEIGEKLSSLL